MEFDQIQELVKLVSKHKLSEFSLKQGDFKLVIRNQGTGDVAAPVVVAAPSPVVTMPVAAPVSVTLPPAPVAAPKADAPAAPAPAISEDSKLIAIKSPMVGTFYRSTGPDKPPFVKIGDTVDAGSKVCIIEAMKLFNEIESEVKGKIVKILVEDASPVEYEQPLFLVEPA
jgi:acetyl-CoA carboxylase biotin carboxyl carrier protein